MVVVSGRTTIPYSISYRDGSDRPQSFGVLTDCVILGRLNFKCSDFSIESGVVHDNNPDFQADRVTYAWVGPFDHSHGILANTDDSINFFEWIGRL